MGTFPDKKLKPYLFPFKIKPEISRLFTSITNSPVDLSLYYPHTRIRMYQDFAQIMCSNAEETFKPPTIVEITDFQMNEKDLHVQTKLKSLALDNMSPCSKKPHKLAESVKTTAFNVERFKCKITAQTKLNSTVNIEHEVLNSTELCQKSKTSNDVMLETPEDVNTPCARPKPIYMIFERPACLDTRFKRPVPEDVSWTRIDREQKKMDMIPPGYKVAMGVFAGMVATAVVHPLDVIKVRLQLFPKKVGTLRMLSRITACEGQKGLYAGLTAGLLRQITYTGSRLYVYNSLYDWLRSTREKEDEKSKGKSKNPPPPPRPPTLSDRLGIAIFAGLVGAFMGVPSEMALVRMIEVHRLRRSACSPPCSQVCKKVDHPASAIGQLWRIAKKEGIMMWWRGGVSTLLRSVLVSIAQVGVYTEIRRAFTHDEMTYTGIEVHLYTAMLSSLISTVLSLPVDQVKTRYQSYSERHRRSIDILNGILKTKGVKYLWKGFMPYYFRQVIHTVITYVLLDTLINSYVSHVESNEAAEKAKKKR